MTHEIIKKKNSSTCMNNEYVLFLSASYAKLDVSIGDVTDERKCHFSCYRKLFIMRMGALIISWVTI